MKPETDNLDENFKKGIEQAREVFVSHMVEVVAAAKQSAREEMREKVQKAIDQVHGGGNGRRLLHQLLASIGDDEETYMAVEDKAYRTGKRDATREILSKLPKKKEEHLWANGGWIEGREYNQCLEDVRDSISGENN